MLGIGCNLFEKKINQKSDVKKLVDHDCEGDSGTILKGQCHGGEDSHMQQMLGVLVVSHHQSKNCRHFWSLLGC